jgi:signal transduction histidine kinase
MKRFISILALAALPLYANEPQTESVRGTVLYSQAWQFFLLKTEARVVRVQTRQGDPALSPGDVVEARGVPARRNGRITVEAATYEKTGENGVVPETQLIGPKDFPRVFDEGKPSDLYGMPVRLKARVLNVIPREWAITDIDIECGGEVISASINGYLDDELGELLALHPDVELEGFLIVLDIDLPNGETPKIDLRLPDSDAITIIPNTAFRRRLLAHKVSKAARYAPWLLLVVVAALSFKLYRARQVKSRLQAVIAERRRMAADLHDSIEQHLAGARLYLDSMLPEDGSPAPEELKPIELARDILVTAKREIRETIWNLRIDELTQKRPKDVLMSLVQKLASTTAVRVEAILKGLPETLPEALFSDILYVVQESVTNAIKHGKATRILIASDARGPKKFELRIVNNGAPFDTQHALGPEAGHFGLSGMRERARRSGFAISLASKRHTTSVRLEIKT